MNESLRTINLESNYLSGHMLRDLIEALLDKQYVVEFRASNQRPAILGNRIEMEIANLVQQNKALLKLGLNFDVPNARHMVATRLQQNNDICEYHSDPYCHNNANVYNFLRRPSEEVGFGGRLMMMMMIDTSTTSPSLTNIFDAPLYLCF